MARARAPRPGFVVSAIAWLLAIALLGACGQQEPETPAGTRTWEGGTLVTSSGVVVHERREIAQKVPLPACITVGADLYRFARVAPFAGGGTTPPGLNDTFYRLDRWRLWTRPGALEGQPVLFVTIRGSTGILAEYERTEPGQACGA